MKIHIHTLPNKITQTLQITMLDFLFHLVYISLIVFVRRNSALSEKYIDKISELYTILINNEAMVLSIEQKAFIAREAILPRVSDKELAIELEKTGLWAVGSAHVTEKIDTPNEIDISKELDYKLMPLHEGLPEDVLRWITSIATLPKIADPKLARKLEEAGYQFNK